MEIPVRATRSLAGKVAIVTGAGSLAEGIGNGRASAILLAEEGATVICVDVKPEPVRHTVEMITKEGKGKAIALTADVTEEEDCKKIVDTALETFGRLDILINNVGVSGPKGTAVEVDMAAWAKVRRATDLLAGSC
jgi:NAD(P)-dependent dehydrogenase (short-subunit alcohol dehydrogenase family)